MSYTKLALVAALLAGTAQAHHSFAMFDAHKQVTLNGTVKDFQWSNPHIWIQFLAPDLKTGQVVEWSIEGGTPNSLSRSGWWHGTLKPGDQVAITIHPLLTGDHGGALMSATGSAVRLRQH